MRKQRLYPPTLIALSLLSCGVAKPPPACEEATASFALATSPFTWKGACQKVSLTFSTSSPNGCTPPTPSTVAIAITPQGTLHSDSACLAPVSTTAFPGTGTGVFYAKVPHGNTAEITASLTGVRAATVPLAIGKSTAASVLGQPGFTANAPNNGSLGAASLQFPYSVARVGTKLIVADSANHRVLIWNSPPASSADLPNVVLGQPDFTSADPSNGGISARSLDSPSYVHSDGTRLFVTDAGNHRVLIWSSIPTNSYAAANLVVGQPDFLSGTANNGGLDSDTLKNPNCAFVSGSKLFVCDSANHRVLVFNRIPRRNGEAADLVLGQPDFRTATAAAGAGGMNLPVFARVSATKLFVSDYENNRLLIWNALPTANGAAADLVLGQPDFTQTRANNGGPSASSLNGPGESGVDGQGRFYVTDYGNSRILLWNRIPTVTRTAADAVIGQSNMHHNYANEMGTVSATGLGLPWGLDVSGTELWTADYLNHRVLRIPLP